MTEKIRAEALLPGQLELPVVIGTVSQIEVNQGLIGDAFGVGQRLEVVDGAAVDIDGNLLFQPVRIGIFSWIQLAYYHLKFHRDKYVARFWLPALPR